MLKEPARKRRILKDAEAALRRLLASAATNPAKLRARAADVREAQLLLLKGQRVMAERAQRALITTPSPRQEALSKHLEAVARRVAWWKDQSDDDVVDVYRTARNRRVSTSG